jgi:hypothetical protein
MRDKMNVGMLLLAISLASCFGTASCKTNKSSETSSASAATQTQAPSQSGLEKQRQDTQQQARPEVENQRKSLEEEATKTLDQDAITVIADTRKAIDQIATGKTDEALAAIEQATGKINILLARNPATAFIPLSAEVDVIDIAPHDTKAIRTIAQEATAAAEVKDFPAARVLLYTLTSEIRSRTYNLPLATYPETLKEAARLLDQKKTQDASKVLLTALNTLVVVDKVTPLPLVLAREAIRTAKEQSQKDKVLAQALVQTAKEEIERSKELGYVARAPEYEALNSDISTLEKQLKKNEDSTSVFAKLEDKLSAFLKRQSQQERR